MPVQSSCDCFHNPYYASLGFHSLSIEKKTLSKAIILPLKGRNLPLTAAISLDMYYELAAGA
jgi:hypothetical protein